MKKLFSMLVLCICVLSAFCWADSKPGRLPTYLTLDQLDIQNNLNIKGYSLTNVGGISGKDTYVSVGDQVTSHALGGKGDIVCGKFEANGAAYCDNGLIVEGTINTSIISFEGGCANFNYANNNLRLGVRHYSTTRQRNFLLLDYDNLANNYGNTQSANPTFFIYSSVSAVTATNQWLSLTHNQTDAVINSGKGSVQISTHTIVTGDLIVGGALSLGYEVLTDSGTITNNSGTVVNCTKDGIMSVTLPTAVGNQGLYFKIKKSGTAGAVSLITVTTETIDGTDDPVYVDAQYDFIGIVSDNANWIVVDRYIQ